MDRRATADAIEREAGEEVEAAVRFARDSPFPDPRIAADAGVREMSIETTFVEAIATTLARAMREDERVIVLGEDVAEGGPYLATAGLAEEFGRERVRNTPISEGTVCGVAIGAAQSGLRPVVEIMFIDFITLALDQLVNQAAKAHFMSGGQLSVPLVLRTQGGSGQRNGAQHSQSLEAWLTHVPGLKVVMPSDAADAAGLLQPRSPTRTRWCSSRTSRCTSAARPSPIRPRPVPIGQAKTLRAGRDVTIIALSRLVGDAIEAADRLASERDRGRGDRPAHAGPARPRHARAVGQAHRPRGGGARGGDRRRVRRRARGAAAGGRIRLPRGADPARRRAVHAGAGQPAARGRLPSRRARRSSRPRAIALEWGEHDVEPWEHGAIAAP